MYNFEKLFSGFTVPESYNLLDGEHPLEFYIGIDGQGRKTLILRNENKPEFVKSTSSIDVAIGQVRNNQWSIGFHLKDNSMSGLFYRFCEDLLESSKIFDKDENGMKFITKRYSQWKKMFYKLKKDLLTETEIMGLIGELLFLKNDIMKKYPINLALESWVGCDKAKKDFSINDEWYEIKTTHAGSLTIKISSIEQLDSKNDGTLVIYELEKMSGVFDGICLNSLISDILSSIPIECEDILFEKLKEYGYYYDDEYDKYIYRLVSKGYYIVNDAFPRLKITQISKSIVKAQYEILKRDLLEFRLK